jgi:biotin carboxyl carrier protein
MNTEQQVQQTAAAIRQMVADIAKLARTDVPRQAFFKEFIVRAVRAIDAQGGAVWIGRDGRFNLIADVDLESSQFSASARQHEGIRAALRWVEEHGRALIIAPMGPEGPDDPEASGIANLTPMPFFYVPIKAAGRVVGVLQVWQRPGRDPRHFRAFVEFLIQVALYAEGFLESRQLDTVVRETQRLEQMLLLTERLAAAESAEVLALQAANLGRELVSADRLTVLAAQGRACRTLATSGQARVERRSELVRTIEQLAATAAEAGAAKAYRRPAEGDDVPAAVRQHFAASTLDMAVVMPLRHGERIVGTLVAEYARAGDRPNDEDLAALESMSRQTGPALASRLESERLPLRRTVRLLAALRPERGRLKLMVVVAAAVFIAAAALVPVETEIAAPCSVWPVERGGVVATEGGTVAEVLVTEGQAVEAGQPMVRLKNQTLEAALSIAIRDVARAEAEARQAEAAGDVSAKLVAEGTVRKAESEVAFLRGRVGELTLCAPMPGTVVTRDPGALLGTEIKRGQRVLDIADLGRWEVAVDINESDLLDVEESIRANADRGGAHVEFLLAAQSGRPMNVRADASARIAPAAKPTASGRNVFTMRVEIPPGERDGADLRLGYEGKARIAGPTKSWLRSMTDPLVNRIRMAMF